MAKSYGEINQIKNGDAVLTVERIGRESTRFSLILKEAWKKKCKEAINAILNKSRGI